MSKKNPRIVLAGSVNSSRRTLEKLFEHRMNVTGVLGLAPEKSQNVSGYVDLKPYAESENVIFSYFQKINTHEVIDYVQKCKPDFLFVVGLSQLIGEELLKIPTVGCVGFHPTRLPKGRGRGAVAWLILEKAPGAVTFFEMGSGMDDGPILAQKPFEVYKTDYACNVIDRIVENIGDCLDELLPLIKSGELKPVEQDHKRATYLGKRNPEDGEINWGTSSEDIVNLVRAVSAPLPGAYSYYNGTKIFIEKAVADKSIAYTGVTGRVLKYDQAKGVLVQAGTGVVWLQQIQGLELNNLRVGQSFESEVKHNISMLKDEIEFLKKNKKNE